MIIQVAFETGKSKKIHIISKINLTFISSDGIHKFNLRIVLSHLFYHLPSLKCQFIRWWHTQALKKQQIEIKIVIGIKFSQFHHNIHVRCSQQWEMKTNLRIFSTGIHMTEHRQNKRSCFTRSRLWLGDQILWTRRMKHILHTQKNVWFSHLESLSNSTYFKKVTDNTTIFE